MTEVPDLLRKAEVALLSARHLLDLGDFEGAADRAYYGLFHAARALLFQVEPDDAERLKTHASVIAAFGLIGVRRLGLPVDHGRLLNFAQELRRKADYEASQFVSRDAVADILKRSETYLADVRILIERQYSP